MNNLIGYYAFKNVNLLQTALTHTSYANENRHSKIKSNQRLEFLGDSVLSLIVSKYIFKKFPNLPEGELTRIRAAVVCEKTLSECARQINLGGLIRLGKGEQSSGGRERPSILSDGFEALLGAIYLDGGFEAAEEFVLRLLTDKIRDAASGDESFTDYKTQFQELVQREPGNRIEYITAEASGPDHDRLYRVNLTVNNRIIGTGEGKSKKEAEQNAARMGIERLSGAGK